MSTGDKSASGDKPASSKDPASGDKPVPSSKPLPGSKPAPSSGPLPSSKPAPSSGPLPSSKPVPSSGAAPSSAGAATATPSLLPAILVGAALGSVVGFASLFVANGPLAPAPSGAVAPTSSGAPALKASSESTGTTSAAPDETEADYLRRAQAQVSGSPSQALALAEAYPQKYPGGKLGQERELIAIEALSALGRTAEARARTRLFLTLFPDSAHRRRLEVLIPDLAPSAKPP